MSHLLDFWVPSLMGGKWLRYKNLRIDLSSSKKNGKDIHSFINEFFMGKFVTFALQ